MARINIEPEWWSDMRRIRLIMLVGCEHKADGMALSAWKLSQQFWFKKELIPEHAWKGSGFGEDLFECGLAERKPEGIYVRGASRHFEWYERKVQSLRENASKGGKKSAESRKNMHGTAQPGHNHPKQARTDAEANSSRSNPSSSSSSSSSRNTNAQTATPDGFAEFYSGYPKKVGKTQAMKAWKREGGRPGFVMADMLAAREKYRAYCVKSKIDQKFIKHPATFLSEWRDWLDPDIEAAGNGRNYSDLAKDLWEFKKGTIKNPPPELENFIQQVDLDKLHRDDFRGGGAVSGMIKKFFEKRMNSPPGI